MDRLRIVTFTTLFPNPVQPTHGLFVAQRLRHLLADEPDLQARVVAPVPWFPWSRSCFGRYAAYARVPRHENPDGLPVWHPRYPVIPRVGMSLVPLTLALAALPVLRALRRDGFPMRLIDAHYYYPDGVAAALLGQWLGIPVVITGRGTDLNLIPRHWLPRAWIRWAAGRAAASVTVCAALREVLLDLGLPPGKVTVLRNGVDAGLFRPVDRLVARAALGMTRPTLLAVGHLIPRKGHDRIIRALPELPGVDLCIVGEGPERATLEDLARGLGVAARVRMPGTVPQPELPRYYGAADGLVLASTREGWANVLLEAMACGTPVVATPAWGTPEVVAAPEAGLLADGFEPAQIARACRALLAAPPRREATRAYAERFSWRETSRGQRELFRQVLAAREG
ncbi:MAG: glycosyltransferase [Magnetococcales bacterium]|nr:glycosyltransferase [Magnetococcales bacterium]